MFKHFLKGASFITGLLLLLPSHASAQGVGARFDTIALTTLTGQTNLQVIANPVLTVCTAGATGIPCAPLATTYTDQTLTTPCVNPAQATVYGSGVCSSTGDNKGNVGFWAQPGTYVYTITGPGVAGKIFTVTISAGSNSVSGGAVVKQLNGIVFADQYPDFNTAWAAAAAGGKIWIKENFTSTVTGNISFNKDINVECADRQTSIIRAGGAFIMFTGAGTVKNTNFKNCNIDGNNVGISFLQVPNCDICANPTVGVQWYQGAHTLENVYVHGFTGKALDLGASVYGVRIDGLSRFQNNNGDTWFGDDTEPKIRGAEYWTPRNGATNAKIHLQRTSTCLLEKLDIEHLGSTSTAPDLEIANLNGNGGYCDILSNDFKPEGDIANRQKVRFIGSASFAAQGYNFIGNKFFCGATGMTAIEIDSPVNHSKFDNFFNSCANNLVDTSIPNGGSDAGKNTFIARNFAEGDLVGAPLAALFSAGNPKGFVDVNISTEGRDIYRPFYLKEATELRNRITSSPDMTVNWVLSNASISGGVCNTADPMGGLKACTLVRSGTGVSFIRNDIDSTGLAKQMYFNVWLKAGTGTSATMSMQDLTIPAIQQAQDVVLDTAEGHWYSMPVSGVNTGHTYRAIIYIDSAFNGTDGHTIIAYDPYISDRPADFYPSYASGAHSSAIGSNFINGVGFSSRPWVDVRAYGAVGDGSTDDSSALQAAKTAACTLGGGTLFFPAGTYLYKTTLGLTTSACAGVTLQGLGDGSILKFNPSAPFVVGTNDRAIQIDSTISSRRQIANAISIGDTSFVASLAGDTADLVAGDWVIITDMDSGPGEIVNTDWAQVLSVVGTTVNVQHPFRTAFGVARAWVQATSGLGFFRVTSLSQGVSIKGIKIIQPTQTQSNSSINVGVSQGTRIENVTVDNAKGNGIAAYRSKGLQVRGFRQINDLTQATEFAAVVDLSITNSYWGIGEITSNNPSTQANTSSLVLDFGTAFFSVTGNTLVAGSNILMQVTNGVHDGTISLNSFGYTRGTNGTGILGRGAQRLTVVGNVLNGGTAGGAGIDFGNTTTLTVNISTVNNLILGNSVQNFAASYGTQSTSDCYFNQNGNQLDSFCGINAVKANGTYIARQTSTTAFAGYRVYNDLNLNTRALEMDYSGSAFAAAMLTNGPSGEAASIATTGAFPLQIGTNNTMAMTILSNQNVGILNNNPTHALDVTGTFATSGLASLNSLAIGSGTTILKHLSATAVLDFANQAAAGCNDLTVTVTGAALGDVVGLGVPNASVVNGTTFFFGWVSGGNTVTVRYCNLVSGDPASGTFRVDVWQH